LSSSISKNVARIQRLLNRQKQPALPEFAGQAKSLADN
jgi:hypothetical protein